MWFLQARCGLNVTIINQNQNHHQKSCIRWLELLLLIKVHTFHENIITIHIKSAAHNWIPHRSVLVHMQSSRIQHRGKWLPSLTILTYNQQSKHITRAPHVWKLWTLPLEDQICTKIWFIYQYLSVTQIYGKQWPYCFTGTMMIYTQCMNRPLL